MLRTLRDNCRVRPVVLASLGIAVLIVALLVQVPAWLGARRQRRMESWRVVMPLDFSTTNTYRESFQPTQSSIGNPEFTMRGPLLAEFRKTHRGGANIPPEILQESFSNSGVDFSLSWKVLDGATAFESGVFRPNDVSAWSYPDHVYYKAEDSSGYRHVDRERVYSLLVEVTQPCKSLNRLKPTFTLGPPPAKNMTSLARYLLKSTAPFFVLGIGMLLIAAALKYKSVNTRRISKDVAAGDGPADFSQASR